MATEEDECDSSNIFTVASQSDVNAFLQAQVEKITGLQTNISDDDEDISIVHSISTNFSQSSFTKQNDNKKNVKPYLSHSCFASISDASIKKPTNSDDLTELEWLNTFKFKETNAKEQNFHELYTQNDEISRLSNELKTYDEENVNINSMSMGVLIFLALYSKRNDKETPWLLTSKQIYDYIQINIKQISQRRGWKDLVKEALIKIPCFVKAKRDVMKSRSIWTIDPYYRPLLTRAYLTRLPIQVNKTINRNQKDEKEILSDNTGFSESMIDKFAPKSTVKTKVLPRLYERLYAQKQEDENEDGTDANSLIEERLKQPGSFSSPSCHSSYTDNDEKYIPWPSSSMSNVTKRKRLSSSNETAFSISSNDFLNSKVITPCPSVDHMYLNSTREQISINEDQKPIDHIDQSMIHTRTNHTNKKDFMDRRKSSSIKKHLSLVLPLNRPNTRMNRRIIEQDLELLRQAMDLPVLPSNQSIQRHSKTPSENLITSSLN